MDVFPEHGLRNGKLPADIREALNVVTFAFNNPPVFLNDSTASRNLRLDLAKLLVEFPEFLAAAAFCVFSNNGNTTKRKQGVSVSSRIREFLLTEGTILLPHGNRISQTGATDAEIAMAVENRYGLRNVTFKAVRTERMRLERHFATEVTSFVDFYLDVTSELDRMLQPKNPKASRRKRRAELIGLYYKASKI